MNDIDTDNELPVLTDQVEPDTKADPERRGLEGLVRALSRQIIADVADIPAGFLLANSPEIKQIHEQHHEKLAISTDGKVLLCELTDDINDLLYRDLPQLLSDEAVIEIFPSTPFVVQNALTMSSSEFEGDTSVLDIQNEARSDAQRQLDGLIQRGIEEGASDIHLVVERDEARVLYRIKRQLRDRHLKMPHSRALAMIRAAINYDAILGGGQANRQFNPRVPESASFTTRLQDGRKVQIRLQSAPTKNGGFSVALRLLGANIKEQPTLLDLNYLPEHVLIYKQAATMPFGAMVISGPTGSGKSTTLRAALALVPKDKRIFTFEDPVEGNIPAASQVPINEDNPDTDWAAMSKMSLRMDPDVLMYGELRDKIVAAIYVRAAGSGHLVFTTLHTNSAVDIIGTLASKGISYERMADPTFLRVLGAQRLIPQLCMACRLPAREALKNHIDEERLSRHFANCYDKIYVQNPDGCPACDYSGSARDTLIAEVINIDGHDREFIFKGDTNGWLKHLKAKGWPDMKDHAEILVRSGAVGVTTADKQLTTGFGIDTANDIYDYNAMRAFANKKHAEGML